MIDWTQVAAIVVILVAIFQPQLHYIRRDVCNNRIKINELHDRYFHPEKFHPEKYKEDKKSAR